MKFVFGSIDKIQLHVKNLINREFDKGNPLISFYNVEVFKKKYNCNKLFQLKKTSFHRWKNFSINNESGSDEMNPKQHHKYLEQNL